MPQPEESNRRMPALQSRSIRNNVDIIGKGNYQRLPIKYLSYDGFYYGIEMMIFNKQN